MLEIYDREKDPSIAKEFSAEEDSGDPDRSRSESDLLAFPEALGLREYPDLYLVEGGGGYTNERTLKEKLLIASPVLIVGTVAAVQVVKAL